MQIYSVMNFCERIIQYPLFCKPELYDWRTIDIRSLPMLTSSHGVHHMCLNPWIKQPSWAKDHWRRPFISYLLLAWISYCQWFQALWRSCNVMVMVRSLLSMGIFVSSIRVRLPYGTAIHEHCCLYNVRYYCECIYLRNVTASIWRV